MALKVEASFENGVFVPARRPELAESERVRLTIERTANTQADSDGFSHRAALTDLGSQTGLAIALDFHPDGC
jgi:predicted DNA-binding antitoxin AbrB/MazE fold protein